MAGPQGLGRFSPLAGAVASPAEAAPAHGWAPLCARIGARRRSRIGARCIGASWRASDRFGRLGRQVADVTSAQPSRTGSGHRIVGIAIGYAPAGFLGDIWFPQRSCNHAAAGHGGKGRQRSPPRVPLSRTGNGHPLFWTLESYRALRISSAISRRSDTVDRRSTKRTRT